MEEFHVKNYGEYCQRLKENFCDAKKMPSDFELNSFIFKYNLNFDWKIVITDVKKDIYSKILNTKDIQNYQIKRISLKKRITSYEEYLIKLKDVFGIPEVIPKDSEIENFIIEFGLKKDWGITIEDVSKDLEKFVYGKYDELYKDAIQKPKICVRPPTPRYKSIYKYPSADTLKKSDKTKNLVEKSPAPQYVEQRHSQNKKESNSQITVLIDGDNHIDEARKGIEHTTKNIKVEAFFSQWGAKRKFDKKYGFRSNVSSKFIKPGAQAVDNRIKAKVKQLMKRKENQCIVIVSQDTGFAKCKKWNKENKLGNKITIVKSVEEILEITSK